MKKGKFLAKIFGIFLVISLLVFPVSAFATPQENETAAPLLESGMAKIGTAKVVAIYVDFADKKFEEGDTKEALDKIINTPANLSDSSYPFESLHAFYERASYGKLDISGDVYIYHSPKTRDEYVDENTLFDDALDALDETVDFSQYDKNNDGKIDAVYIHFAGGDTGWNSKWWSKVVTFSSTKTYDGKYLFNRVFLHNPSNTKDGAHTIVHETGHVLGLLDLYAFNSPEGRSGTLSWDLMDNNSGDINGYFKWLLGWIDESKITKVVANDDGIKVTKNGKIIEEIPADEKGCSNAQLDLASFDTNVLDEYGGFIIVSNNEIEKYSNFYIIQYETYSGNQTIEYLDPNTREKHAIPNGFRIYRVQGRLTPDHTFLYQNTAGPVHNQLIEILDMDENDSHFTDDFSAPKGYSSEEYKCLLQEGEMVNYSTYPSTNFKENNMFGFTGLSFKALNTSGDIGKIQIGYSPEGKEMPSDFQLKLKDSEFLINDLYINFVAPWEVEQNDFHAFLYINDTPYWVNVSVQGKNVGVFSTLNPEALKQDDVCKVVFPKDMFTIAQIDEEKIYSEEMTIPIPVGPQAKIEEKKLVSAFSTSNNNPILSNTVLVDNKSYICWLDNQYNNPTLHLTEFKKDNPEESTDAVINNFTKEFAYTVNNDAITLFKTNSGGLVLRIHANSLDGPAVDYYYWLNKDTKSIENMYIHNNADGFIFRNNNVTVGDDGTIFIMESKAGKINFRAVSNDDGEIKEYQDEIDSLSSNFGIYRATDPSTNKDYLLIRQFLSSDEVTMNKKYSINKIKASDLQKLIQTSTLASGLKDKSEYYEIETEGGFDFMSMALAPNSILALGNRFAQDKTGDWISKSFLKQFDKKGNPIGTICLDRLTQTNKSEFYNITTDEKHVSVDTELRNDENSTWDEKIILNIADIADYDSSADCGKYISTNVHAGGYFIDQENYATFHLNQNFETGNYELVIYLIKLDNNQKPEPTPDPVPTGDTNNPAFWIFVIASMSLTLILCLVLKRR